MQSKFLYAGTVASLCVAAFLFAPASGQAPPARPKWEYRVVEANETDLNKLGDNGWEVVGTTCDITSRAGTRDGGLSEVRGRARAILKRAK